MGYEVPDHDWSEIFELEDIFTEKKSLFAKPEVPEVPVEAPAEVPLNPEDAGIEALDKEGEAKQ